MKIDPDYIKEILQIMEDEESVFIECGLLMQKMTIFSKTSDYCYAKIDNDKLPKFIKHIYDLRDLNCVECKDLNMGFTPMNTNNTINGYAKYRLTIQGQQLLDVMKNDTWWNKIKGMGKEMTIETLKQAPAIIISTLRQ